MYAGVVLGVAGEFSDVVVDDNGLVKGQKFVSEFRDCGNGEKLRVNLRFDDQCNNGHMTFSITGDIYAGRRDVGGGCCHELISQVFPELKGLIKWHLVSTDEPMHYLSNTLYLAGDKDCWGLSKGEVQYSKETEPHVFGTGVDSTSKWQEEYRRPDGWLPLKFAPKVELPGAEVKDLPRVLRVGEGKERELDAARRIAIWPEATDEQLSLPKDELKALLEARLPGLLKEFNKDMGKVGFVFGLAKSKV